MTSVQETLSGASEQGALSAAPEEAAITKPGVESDTVAARGSDISARPKKVERCEWCGNDAATRCSVCKELPVCSQACMKALWRDHKHTCTKNQAPSAADELADELEGMRLDVRGLWLRLLPDDQKHVVEYLDVVTLCRTDSAMTGLKERRDWQKALKGLKSVAMNKWPRYSNTNNFAGLRWGVQKRINLKSFKIEKVVLRGGGVASRKEQFGVICALGYPDIATLMVKSKSIGVNNKGRAGGTPTYWAALYGLEEVVRALVAAGADLNKADNEGYTPLYIASQEGQLPVVQCLVTAGADINQAADKGRTPLIIASQKGRLPMVQCLVTAEADLNKANDRGATPVYVASQKGRLPVVQYLVTAGADINQAADNGWTPLIAASEEGHLPVVQYLVTAGADLNKAIDGGATPLIAASQEGQLSVVQYLVTAGADLNKAANNGWAPLVIAHQNGHAEVARVLKEAGATLPEHQTWVMNSE